ncbi:DUF998 domain-containing protein [Pseudonocardia sp. GCM10023141]|uniref:DUF998 domain-containing protein n=1 Tax=Pseudonocardia sp. GCM10023141 TaxID=3252653 RepID=UPI0036174B76
MPAPTESVVAAARTRALAASGVAGAAVAIALIGALHVVAAGQVDPVRLTISQYALGPYGWLFDVGVVGLAVGSALVLVALIRADVLRPASVATVLTGAWVLGLLAVVAFEKTNWSVGPSLSGSIHRYASVVAFLALPVAAILIARRGRRRPGSRRFASWTGGLGILALAWFAVILVVVAIAPSLDVSWWQLLPLGLVERGMALTDVAAVVVLGVWALHTAPASSVVPLEAACVAA